MKDAVVIRMDGHGVCEILETILQVFLLDAYVEKPVSLMQVMPGGLVETSIWARYKKVESALYANIMLKKDIVV